METATTTADILPDCAIHIILSRLDFKESARFSILSKTWLLAWLTHPNLEFRVHDLKYSRKVDEILERYRDRKIPIEKLSLTLSAATTSGEVLDKWLGIAIQNGVEYVEFGYADFGFGTLLYPFPVFTILTAKSLRKLVLKDCDLMKFSFLSDGGFVCDSLRELSLLCVRLDDEMLQTLLTICGMIVSLRIKHCIGLKKIELRNLEKIKMVYLHMDKNYPVEIQTPSLEHFFYCGFAGQAIELDMGSCQNLKSLKLSCVKIHEGFLEQLTSRCELLESLVLENVLSKGLKRFKVCGSQYLTNLEIRGCNGLAVIDAPYLESFEYVGLHIPVLKTTKMMLGPLKHSRMELYCFSSLNASWFCKLRKFLFNSNSLFNVTLHFPKCIKIDMDDWDPYRGVFALPQVDVLNVDLAWSVKCPVFVDALLWSCHPRTLNLFSTVQMIARFSNHIMRMKSSALYTEQCQLEVERVHKFDREEVSTKPVEHNEKRRICFSFDWG